MRITLKTMNDKPIKIFENVYGITNGLIDNSILIQSKNGDSLFILEKGHVLTIFEDRVLTSTDKARHESAML